jgi:hypothetical protein
MYSVSFRSRSFNILFCSSSVTSASANFRSSDHRLQQNHGYTHIKLHSSPLISTMKTAVKWADCKKQRTQSVSLHCFAGLEGMASECANNPQQVCQRNSIQEEKPLSLPVQTYSLTSRPFLLTPICLAISGIAKLQPQTNEKGLKTLWRLCTILHQKKLLQKGLVLHCKKNRLGLEAQCGGIFCKICAE